MPRRLRNPPPNINPAPADNVMALNGRRRIVKASCSRSDDVCGDVLSRLIGLQRKPSECLRGNVTDYECPRESDPWLSLREFGEAFRNLARIIHAFGGVLARSFITFVDRVTSDVLSLFERIGRCRRHSASRVLHFLHRRSSPLSGIEKKWLVYGQRLRG